MRNSWFSTFGAGCVCTPDAVTVNRMFDVAIGVAAELTQRCGQVAALEMRRAKVVDRLTRVADVLLDLTTDPHQLLTRGRLGRLEAAGDDIDLQRHADQGLQQRVVNLAAQPRAFGERQRESLLDEAKPCAPRAPHRQRDGGGAQRVEPSAFRRTAAGCETPMRLPESCCRRLRSCWRRGIDTGRRRDLCRWPCVPVRRPPNWCPRRRGDTGIARGSAPLNVGAPYWISRRRVPAANDGCSASSARVSLATTAAICGVGGATSGSVVSRWGSACVRPPPCANHNDPSAARVALMMPTAEPATPSRAS